MNNFFVYILKCADGSYYVGRTHDIEQRLAEHRNKQGGIYTALRLPVILVFQQAFASENEAYAMEQKLKRWSRKKKEALIKGDWEEIVRLSNQ
jgi:predicted GIY-YIG superfamily endonuclease